MWKCAGGHHSVLYILLKHERRIDEMIKTDIKLNLLGYLNRTTAQRETPFCPISAVCVRRHCRKNFKLLKFETKKTHVYPIHVVQYVLVANLKMIVVYSAVVFVYFREVLPSLFL